MLFLQFRNASKCRPDPGVQPTLVRGKRLAIKINDGSAEQHNDREMQLIEAAQQGLQKARDGKIRTECSDDHLAQKTIDRAFAALDP